MAGGGGGGAADGTERFRFFMCRPLRFSSVSSSISSSVPRRPARAVEKVVEEREGQCLPLPRIYDLRFGIFEWGHMFTSHLEFPRPKPDDERLSGRSACSRLSVRAWWLCKQRPAHTCLPRRKCHHRGHCRCNREVPAGIRYPLKQKPRCRVRCRAFS